MTWKAVTCCFSNVATACSATRPRRVALAWRQSPSNADLYRKIGDCLRKAHAMLLSEAGLDPSA